MAAETTNHPKGMKAELYGAALSGSFDEVVKIPNWNEQKTPKNNNVLHVHLGKPFYKKNKMVVNIRFIERLLEDVDGYSLLWMQNSNGDTPLHLAARFGHANAVQILLRKLANVRPDEVVSRMLLMKNSNKDMALHESARAGHAQVVKFLLEADHRNCLQHEPNKQNEIPLYLAIETGCKASVLKILRTCDASALVHKGPCGRTVLHAAVEFGDAVMVSEILEKNRSVVRIQDDEMLTPLHLIAAEKHKLQLLEILLQDDKTEESSTVYIQDYKGRTALHIAMLQQNWEAMRSLINSCPDCIEIVDNDNQNVLHYAGKRSSLGIMKRIMKLGRVDKLINDKDVNGNTPLHLLATNVSKSPNLNPILKGLKRFIKDNPCIDLMAFDKDNRTVGDILLGSDSLLQQEGGLGLFGSSAIARGRRCKRDFEAENKAPLSDDSEKEENLKSLKTAAEHWLVVAALIATLSFTGIITIQEGFYQSMSEDNELVSFKAKPLLKVFLISDAIAFITSIIAILVYLMLQYTNTKWAIQCLSKWGIIMIIISLAAMLIAFLAGVSALSFTWLAAFAIVYSWRFFLWKKHRWEFWKK